MRDIERTPLLSFWCEHVASYERISKPWESRSKKIIKRYKDNRGDTEKSLARFNILWSNIQTLHPAIYAQPPKPNIDRRFQDDDEVGTTVAQILERAVSYYVATDEFDDCMNQVVLDRLLPGRGTAWVRYVPHFMDANVQGDDEVKQEGAQITDDIMLGDEAQPDIYSEDVVLDYVHWQDFGHSPARTWQECRAVWRKVYLDRKELQARFPDTAFKDGQCIVPFDAKDIDKGDSEDTDEACAKRATVYELWDSVTKKAFWFSVGMEDFLDQRDDPLKLKNFFPCPKPVFATLANDSLIPTPDYVLYQDQALELDRLTQRIDALSKALKVVGVYDASSEGVQRMLSENVDNKLIPVENWAMFSEKGGLKGVVDYFPIEMVAGVLVQLYAARDKIKQDIYEITGISDIVRGATNASETATAQQIKGQFATLRLDNMQREVARFTREIVRIMTEIIAENFSIETLKQISGIRLFTEQEKQMALQMAQQGAPLPDKIQEMLQKPTWEEVESIIRNDAARCFRIDIETDSTIKADQEAEKSARAEFLASAGSFLQQAVQVPNPELQPLLMEMLMFGVRGFKIGREMETTFKVTLDKMHKQAEEPQQPIPDPQAEVMAMQQQREAEKMKFEAAKAQNSDALKRDELMLKGQEIELRRVELAQSDALERERMALEREKIILDAKTKLPTDIALTDPQLNANGSPLVDVLMTIQAGQQQTAEALAMMAQQQAIGTAAIVDAVTKPKRVDVRRDASGKMTSAEVQ